MELESIHIRNYKHTLGIRVLMLKLGLQFNNNNFKNHIYISMVVFTNTRLKLIPVHNIMMVLFLHTVLVYFVYYEIREVNIYEMS